MGTIRGIFFQPEGYWVGVVSGLFWQVKSEVFLLCDKNEVWFFVGLFVAEEGKRSFAVLLKRDCWLILPV